MPDTKTKDSILNTSFNLRELSEKSPDLEVTQKLNLLKTELLLTIDLFKTIPSDILKIIVDESFDIYLPKNTILFNEGDTELKSMLVILSGRLLVYKSKKNIAELGPGEYVGEMPLIDYRPRSASVKTLEDTLLLEIQEDLFRKHIAPNSSALLAMMRVFASRTREDLIQMEKEMRRLSNFTHDMRNCLVPLGTAETILNTVLGVLYGTKPNHKKRHGWQEVQKGFDAMVSVRNNLITMIDQSLACIKKTQSEYIRSEFELVQLVEETVDEISCHKKLKKKILDIQKPDVPVIAKINYLDIKRVLQNLIINAGYATESGKKITVSIQPLDDWVEISVEDEGTGIPEDVKPILLHDNYTSKPDGHGFGLMSCKAIIENHHQGKIGFDSEWGRGTRFFFRLPLPQ
ncbi:MAG: ATP-binding protein [Nitrospinota bacterium]|nr:ATP-binding protein [Nitrospinota bacterium]